MIERKLSSTLSLSLSLSLSESGEEEEEKNGKIEEKEATVQFSQLLRTGSSNALTK